MSNTYFVAGTDTGVGKTLVATALLAAAKAKGMTTLGLKPIAAGCDETVSGPRNEDALMLQKYSSVHLSYEQVNPVALQEPVAPHIAAAREGRRLSLDRIEGFCRGALMQRADLRLIEGAGGWRVPLNERENLSGLAVRLQTPVILVVGLRLGCLSHALLTAEAIVRDGVAIAGWVASSLEPSMPYWQDNIETLRLRFAFPLLGHIPFLERAEAGEAAVFLDVDKLLLKA